MKGSAVAANTARREYVVVCVVIVRWCVNEGMLCGHGKCVRRGAHGRTSCYSIGDFTSQLNLTRAQLD